jgi:hypothetical protein
LVRDHLWLVLGLTPKEPKRRTAVIRQVRLVSGLFRLFGPPVDNGALVTSERKDESADMQVSEDERRFYEGVARQRSVEANRERQIRRFKTKQNLCRRWISFTDIADWCSRENGSIRSDDYLRALAYRQLGQAVADGEFESGGRTRVLFLNPSVRWFKMTRDRFERCPIDITSDVRMLNLTTQIYLASCWIPRDLCVRWFERRRLPPPLWLAPGISAAPGTTQSTRQQESLPSKDKISQQTTSVPSDSPEWFSLMQAVAWIVARDSRIVSYASPENTLRGTYFIDAVLPNRKRISEEVEAPSGMSLLWLDAFAAFDSNAAPPTEGACRELLIALRSGQITARGTWVETGERRDIGSDEWHSWVIDSPPRDDRVLLPHHRNSKGLAHQAVARWVDVLLPRPQLLTVWPPLNVEQTRAAEDTSATVGARREASQFSEQLRQAPPVSIAALRSWYIERSKDWPPGERPPSSDQDLLAAREHFKGHSVSREAVRALRADFAPEAWKAKGRRKCARQ